MINKRCLQSMVVLFGILCIGLFKVSADTIPVSFTSFGTEGGTVTFQGTNTVTLDDYPYTSTDPNFSGYTLLQNNPQYGDSGITIPGNAISLSFEYDFTEANGTSQDPYDNDEFSFQIYDGSTGSFIAGDYKTETVANVYFSLDLTSLTTDLIGIEFELADYDDVAGSSVTIRNLRIETQAAPVPEPATVFLLGLGLSALAFKTRKHGLLA